MQPSFIRRATGLILLLIAVGLLSCQTMLVSLVPPGHAVPAAASQR